MQTDSPKTRNKPPAFQFYADDFLGGVFTMTLAERGLYITALSLQWTRGFVTLPELERLASGHGVGIVESVAGKFKDDGTGRLKNERLEIEREKQRVYRDLQSQKGQASAQARFNRGSTAVEPSGQPNTQPKANSPSPSPSPIKIKDVGRAAGAAPTSDGEWLESLKKSEAYAGIDVGREYAKAGQWCQANKKQLSRRRFVNWLNRVERPIEGTAADAPSSPPPYIAQKEFDRIEAAIKSLRASYGEHQRWTDADKTKWATLKARKAELMKILGVSA